MIIDRISRIFGTGRLSSLLLEVFAIFLGISASFVVEEWRQERQDVEIFEHFLEAIYYDAAREQAVTSRIVYLNNQVVGALGVLLGPGADGLADDQLMALLNVVLQPWSQPRGDASYQALLAADLSLEHDDTMQQIHDLYATRDLFFTIRERLIEDHSRALAQAMGDWGLYTNAPIVSWDEAGGSLVTEPRLDHPMYAGVRKLLDDFGAAEFVRISAERARNSLRDPDSRRILNQTLQRVVRSSDMAIAVMGTDQNIQAVVRERLPDIRLPVRSLGLVGSATRAGWVLPQAEPLAPERGQRDWWSAELTLTDGMAKFVANENYGTSWGTDYSWAVVDPLAHETFYLGDPDAVFPTGTGVLDGQNIPIRAGRYRVRFNVRTYEYAFDRLDDAP
ncbi:MAG: hypothetical protein R3233_06505 [Xanthomonadales bacterium]|nr:hypothetical protein [Xanthomonadales bacterium]